MESSTQPTLTQHVRDIAVLFEHGSSTFVIATEAESRCEGGRHDFGVIHLPLWMFLMAYRFQQILT